MRTYRTGWLLAGIALLLVGVGAAAHASPRAVLIAFVVVAVACSFVSSSAVGISGTARPRRVRPRLVATSALIGGAVAVALVGFAALLGQRAVLLAFVVLVSSPPAVRAYGRWLRSMPTPSAAQLSAIARAFANAGVGYVGIQPEPGPRQLTDEEFEPTLARRAAGSAATKTHYRGDPLRGAATDLSGRVRKPVPRCVRSLADLGCYDDGLPDALCRARPRLPRQDQLGRTDPRARLMSASRSELGRGNAAQGHRSSVARPGLALSVS